MGSIRPAGFYQSPSRTRMKKSNLETIEDALVKGNLAIIFGTGISINALNCASHITDHTRAATSLTWQNLILKGLIDIRKDWIEDLEPSERHELECYEKALESESEPIATGTLLRAATFLKTKLKELEKLQPWLDVQFKKLYDTYIKGKENPVLDSVRELYNAGATVMTTNYDDLISRHCGTIPLPATNEPDTQDFFIKEHERRPILHIHGVWSEGYGAVLDSIDYFKVSTNGYLQEALKALFLSKAVVLFVGTGKGLEDPNFSQLLSWASKKQLAQRGKNAFVLVAENEQKPSGSFLEAVRYGPHERLSLFLRERAWNIRKRKFKIKSDLTHTPIVPMREFVGRKHELDGIEDALQPGRLVGSRHPLVLWGLRGVGKTQLALQYADEHKDDDYTAVLWIRCETEALLQNDFAEFSRKIPSRDFSYIAGYDTTNPGSAMKVTEGVLQWLNEPDNSGWLIIFDNVTLTTEGNDHQMANGTPLYDIREYLRKLQKGTIIITCSAKPGYELGREMKVQTLNVKHSERLLAQSSGSGATCKQTSDCKCRLLAERLDGLPIALKNAGYYMRQEENTCKQCLENYLHQQKSLLRYTPVQQGDAPPSSTTRYPSLAEIFDSPIAAAVHTNAICRDFLAMCAFWSYRDLYLSAFNFSYEGAPDWLRQLHTKSDVFTSVLNVLEDYSFLQKEESGSYSMSPVLQDQMRDTLDGIEWVNNLQIATKVIAASASSPELSVRFKPHAERCASFWRDPGDEDIYLLLNMVSRKRHRRTASGALVSASDEE